MIGKGTPHNNGAKLATYMITGKDNEIAALWQLRGFASDNIVDAFRSIQCMALATKCEQPFFHVQVRNPEGEVLSRKQWEYVADRMEAKLGFTGQARAIAFHMDQESGHEHMHVAWSRIDGDTMKAIPLSWFKNNLCDVCRELEIEMGLTRVSSERQDGMRAPKRSEEEQARRLGVDLKATRQNIRDAYERTDNGKSFIAALAEHGLHLAPGDRRSWVVIDSAGGLHALGQRILGVKVAAVNARFSDLDRETMLGVEETREFLTKSKENAKTRAVRSERQHGNTPGQMARLLEALESMRCDPPPQASSANENLKQQADADERARQAELKKEQEREAAYYRALEEQRRREEQERSRH